MKLTFAQKLWLPLVLSLISLASVSVYSAYVTRAIRLEERKSDLKHATELASTTVKSLAEQAAADHVPLDVAKQHALQLLKNFRYGESGYFTVFDNKAVIMHATKPEMIGKSTTDFADPNGVHLYRDGKGLVDKDGKGFNTYSFPRPGGSEAFPKVAFNMGYAPWGWYFQTGAYIDDIDAAFHQSLLHSLALLGALAVVLLAAVTAINRGIMKTLGGEPGDALAVANRIADNDLSVTVKTREGDDSSLMHAMRRMRDQLTQTIGSIKQSIDISATATHQIAAGNLDLSQRTEEQAASISETVASMSQLTTAATANAEHARQANQLVGHAVEAAERGNTVVSRAVDTMDGIHQSSSKITQIVSLIEGIAFQTNILALNAAVEAARAGEQGRGFTVVATEVRSLAQRSSEAAKQIKGLIQQSVEQISSGVEYVNEAGTAMTDIQQAVGRVTTIVADIRNASERQGHVAMEIDRAVGQMESVTQQNAALVEEAAAAAKSLESQTSDLRRSVGVFRLA